MDSIRVKAEIYFFVHTIVTSDIKIPVMPIAINLPIFNFKRPPKVRAKTTDGKQAIVDFIDYYLIVKYFGKKFPRERFKTAYFRGHFVNSTYIFQKIF